MLDKAFNAMTKLHGRTVTLKRLGTTDQITEMRITPSNFIRNLEGPSNVIIEGREFVISLASIVSPFSPVLKRADRIVDPELGTLTIDEIREIYNLGGAIMGYRVRCE